METQLCNIVRTHKGNKSIFAERISKESAQERIRNLKRRARDNHSGVYFDIVDIPADVAASVVPHDQ